MEGKTRGRLSIIKNIVGKIKKNKGRGQA